MATRTVFETQRMRHFDRVLNDVDLVGQARRDVDRGIADDQRIFVPGNIEDEAVADARAGAQTIPRNHRAHQLVRVQAALHQRLAPAFADQRDRGFRGGVAVRRVLDRNIADVEPGVLRRLQDLRLRSDQDGVDDALLPCCQRALQRAAVAGVHDGNGCRRQSCASGEEVFIAPRVRKRGHAHLLRSGHNQRFRQPGAAA